MNVRAEIQAAVVSPGTENGRVLRLLRGEDHAGVHPRQGIVRKPVAKLLHEAFLRPSLPRFRCQNQADHSKGVPVGGEPGSGGGFQHPDVFQGCLVLLTEPAAGIPRRENRGGDEVPDEELGDVLHLGVHEEHAGAPAEPRGRIGLFGDSLGHPERRQVVDQGNTPQAGKHVRGHSSVPSATGSSRLALARQSAMRTKVSR